MILKFKKLIGSKQLRLGLQVRAVEINGEPWLVGKDVAEALGYRNPSKALADHVDKEDKLNNESLSSLGQRGGWLINESGFYSLILRNDMPKAKEFKRWVTSEVLPSIRKTGGYIPVQEGTNVEIIECDGEVLFELYSTGMALGYARSNGKSTGEHGVHKLYPYKSRIDKTISNADIEPVVHGVQKYLTEEMLRETILTSGQKITSIAKSMRECFFSTFFILKKNFFKSEKNLKIKK